MDVTITRSIVRWATVLGGTGLACGFIGPMVFAPEANQGPMLGLFITGPGGAVLGAFVGGLVQAFEVGAAAAKRALQLGAAALAAVTLYAAIPKPHYVADLVHGELRGCTPPGQLRGAAVKRLEEFAAAHPPLRNPVDWGSAVDRTLSQDRGVVVEVQLAWSRRLYRAEARWNLGLRQADPWVFDNRTVSYFVDYAGGNCAAFPAGTRLPLRVVNRTGTWPPDGVAEMLNLSAAAPPDAGEAGLAEPPLAR